MNKKEKFDMKLKILKKMIEDKKIKNQIKPYISIEQTQYNNCRKN